MRSALHDLCRCAKQLGIFAFELCEERRRTCCYHGSPAAAEELPVSASRLVARFAVSDEATNPTIHALLESVHPDSVGIYKFDQDERVTPTALKSLSWPYPN